MLTEKPAPIYQNSHVTLYQGDCLEIMPQLEPASIDMVLCDLPYGVTARNKWDEVIPFVPIWESYFRLGKSTTPYVLTATQPFASALVMSCPHVFKYEWIWEKDNGTGFLNAKKQPLRNHEQVLVYYDSQPVYNPQMRAGFKAYTCKSGRASTNYGEQLSVVTENNGERYPLTVLDFKRDKDKQHPTQKPVALFEYLIRTYTHEGMLVLDNCAGSGTTGVAAMRSNRRAILIEKEPAYCDVIIKRLQEEEKRLSGDKTN